MSALSDKIGTHDVVTTGLVYLELLRGFTRPSTKEEIHRHFDAVLFVEPNRSDYVGAAELSVACRRAGVQLPAVDALIAQLCIANNLMLLTADADFTHAASHIPLKVWSPA